MSSSSASIGSFRRGERCRCRQFAILRTSWTDENPVLWLLRVDLGIEGCNYFRWVDNRVCPRGMDILLGFLANRKRMGIELADARVKIEVKNDELEAKNAESEAKNDEIVGLIDMNTELVEQNRMLKKQLAEMKFQLRSMRAVEGGGQKLEKRDMNETVSSVWMKMWIVLGIGAVGYIAMKAV
ncbi:hypothetical protein OROHE_023233 [Orobanche hederae]